MFLKVTSDDQMPNQICDECFNEVRNWINFKQKCSNADSNLKDYLQNLQVREESADVSRMYSLIFMKFVG